MCGDEESGTKESKRGVETNSIEIDVIRQEPLQPAGVYRSGVQCLPNICVRVICRVLYMWE